MPGANRQNRPKRLAAGTARVGAILTYQLLTAGNYSTLPSPLTNVPVNIGTAAFTLTPAQQLIDLNVDARAWAK